MIAKQPRKHRQRDLLLQQLEDRILFDATPLAMIDLPGSEFINESFNFSVDFENDSATSGGPNDTGFGPYVDLHADRGLDIDSASYLGSDVTLIAAGEFNSNGDLVELGSIDPDTNPLGDLTDHPLLGTPLSGGQEGDLLYVIELPFGSFVPDQPEVRINLSGTLDKADGAAVGQPLSIDAFGGFQFGTDPLDNPETDPPLRQATASTDSITPTLLTLTKTSNAAEQERVSGENFPITYTLRVDVATGETVNSLQVRDLLENTLEYLPGTLTIIGGGSATSEPTTPGPQNSPSNELVVDFGTVTGAAGNDLTITYQAFTPEFDANGVSIIDALSGNDEIGLNESSVSATYDHDGDGGAETAELSVGSGDDSGAVGTFDNDGTDYRLNQRSIAVQKSVAVVGGGNAAPGATLEYTLNFQISDYFEFDQLVFDDLFSDGQRFDFDAGSTPTFTITDVNGTVASTFTVRLSTDADGGETFIVDETEVDLTDNASEDLATDGTTRLTINLSDALIDSGRAGGIITGGEGTSTAATGQIKFRTVIQEEYADDFPSGDRSVDLGDSVSNSVTVTGRIRHETEPEANWLNESDSSGASVSIVGPTLVKEIYAIDGVLNPATAELAPGTDITYRIQLTLPIADVENLVLTDFLPVPVFLSDDYDGNGTANGNDGNNFGWTLDTSAGDTAIPVAGTIKFGDNHTLDTVVPSVTPTLDVDDAQNSLSLDFGTFDDPGSQAAVIDILFTVTASDEPFADRLLLTNQANATYGTTGNEASSANALRQVTLRTPQLQLTKGVVSTDAESPTFTAGVGPVTFAAPGQDSSTTPAFTGQIDSSGLTGTPIDADLEGVDAGDLVKFAIVVENTGGADGFNLLIQDALPSGFRIPPSGEGLNLEVRTGDGTLLSIVGSAADLFTTGIEIVDPSGTQGAVGDFDTADAAGDGSNVVVVTYDLEALPPVGANDGILAGSERTEEAELVSYGGVDGSANDFTDGETGNWIDAASVTALAPTLVKEAVGTSVDNASNAADEAVIGELIQYRITLTVPEGTLGAATIQDQLDSGLEFVGIDSVTASAGLTVNGGAADNTANWTSTPAAGATGSNNFVLGTVDNTDTNNASDETIVIVYSARVQNAAGNQSTAEESGPNLNNRARLRWDHDGNGAHDNNNTAWSNSATTAVIESQLAVTQTISGGATNAGDDLTLSVVVDHAAASETDAFDVTFENAIPSEIEFDFATDVTITHSVDGDVSGLFEVVGGTLRTQAGSSFDLLEGQSLTITLNGTLASDVEPGEQITNTPEVRWTSLNDGEASGSATSSERDGEGTLNDYAASDSDTLTVEDIAITKSLISTSVVNTNNANGEAVIGETAVYEVVVTLPEGDTNAAELIDNLEEGLQFVSLDSIIASSGVATSVGTGDFTDTGSFTPASSGDGVTGAQTLTFSLGNLTNSNDSPAAETITLRYTVRVVNSDAVGADTGEDDVLTNSATFQWTRTGEMSADSSNTASASLAVIEPDLDIAQTVNVNGSGTQGDAGDTVNYQFTIDHAATSTDAYDVTFSSTIDDGIDFAIGDVTVTHSTAGDITSLFEVSSGELRTQSGQSFDLLEGETVTIAIAGTLNTSIQPGEQIDNTGEVRWTSLNDGEESGGSSTERDGESGEGTAPDDYVQTSNTSSITIVLPTLSKDFVETSIQATDGSGENDNTEAVVGELVTYRLTIAINEGTTYNAHFVDTFDLGLAFEELVSISTSSGVTSSAGDLDDTATVSVTDNGEDGITGQQVVTFSLGNLTNPADSDAESIVLTYRARVVNAATVGSDTGDTSSLNNSARFRWNNPNGTGTLQTAADSAANVTVIEPTLTASTAVALGGTGAAGDPLTFTTTIEHAAGSEADAFDLTFSDAFPSDVTFSIADVTVTHDDSTVQTDITSLFEVVSGELRTRSSQSFDLLIGETVTVEVAAGTSSTVEAGETISNDATVRWTSIDDDVASGGVSSERDGGASAPDDYVATASNSATLAEPTLTKTLDGTSVTSTNNLAGEATLGETATYRLVIDLPQGVTNAAEIVDQLDQGLVFVSLDSIAASSGVASSVDAFTNTASFAPTVTGNGTTNAQTLAFDLGNLTNTNDNAAVEQITLVYTARVANIAANDGNGASQGTLLGSVARLDWTISDEGDQSTANSSPADIEVIEPQLTVTKTVDDDQPNLGQTVTYTLEISHTAASDTDAFDIRVQDTIPTGMTLQLGTISVVGATIDSNASSGNAIDLTLDRLNNDVGADITITYDAVVTSNPTILSTPNQNNTVDIKWTSLEGASTQERDADDSGGQTQNDYEAFANEAATIINADLRVVKDNGVTTLTPGQSVTYTITVHNDGDDASTGTTVTDTLDLSVFDASTVTTNDASNVTFVAGTGLLTWDAGTIAASGSKALTVTVSVLDSVDAARESVTNTATATHDDPEPTTANNTDSDTDTVSALPDYVISITDNLTGPATAGQTFQYTIQVLNEGNQDGTGVTVSGTLPVNVLDGATVSTDDPGNFTFNSGTGAFTWSAGSLAGDSTETKTLVVTVAVQDPVGAGLENINTPVSVADDGAGGAEADLSDNTAADPDTIAALPDYAITKTDNLTDPATPGQTFDYTIQVVNNGDQDGSGVTVTDFLPIDVIDAASVATDDPSNVTYNQTTGELTWSAGSLAGNGAETKTLVITVTMQDPIAAGLETISNTATVTDDGAGGADPDTSDNSSTNGPDAINAAPDYVIAKTDNLTGPVEPGQTFDYTISVTNAGDQDGSGVTVTDFLPIGVLDATSVSTDDPSNVTYNQATGELTWSVGGLAGNSAQTRELTITVTMRDPAPAGANVLGNTATVADDGAGGSDATPGDNSSTNSDTIDALPDYAVTIDNGRTTSSPSDTVEYVLTVVNNGDQNGTGVVAVVDLPLDAFDPTSLSTDDSANVSFNQSTGRLEWAIGDVDGRGLQTEELRITVTLRDPVAVGVENINVTAAVSDDAANGADPNTGDNTNNDLDTLDAQPNLRIEKTNDLTGSAVPGQVVNYILTVSNNGDQDVANAIVTDQLPLHVLVASSVTTDDPGNVAYDASTGELVWTAGPLTGRGGAKTLTVTVEVQDPVGTLVGTFDNTASVNDTGAGWNDPDSSDNSTSNTAGLDATPDYEIIKSDDVDESVMPTDSFQYTLVVTNLGNQNGTGVVVTDDIPIDLIDPTSVETDDPTNVTFDETTGRLTWNVGSLAGRGDTRTLVVDVTVQQFISDPTIEFIPNTATVADDGLNGPDFVLDNNSSSIETGLLVFSFDSGNDFSAPFDNIRQPGFGNGGFLDATRDTPGGLASTLGNSKSLVDYQGDVRTGIGSFTSPASPLGRLPINPIYSGVANPGATLRLAIYDENGVQVGDRTVLADTGGNWLANFPDTLIDGDPHRIEVEQTAAGNASFGDAGYNLRRYYSPSLTDGLYFNQAPTVSSVMRDAPFEVLKSQHEANLRPLTLVGVTGDYELATASIHAANR